VTASAFVPHLVSRPNPTSAAPMSGARSEFLSRASGYDLEPSGVLTQGDLELDTDAYGASMGGKPIDLSPRQVELLAVFLAAPGRVWSREQLHWICWGDIAPSRRVDVQLCRIRTKVGIDLFRNIRDRGWTLQIS
jgi:DNA-binding response OmpR family regulator